LPPGQREINTPPTRKPFEGDHHEKSIRRRQQATAISQAFHPHNSESNTNTPGPPPGTEWALPVWGSDGDQNPPQKKMSPSSLDVWPTKTSPSICRGHTPLHPGHRAKNAGAVFALQQGAPAPAAGRHRACTPPFVPPGSPRMVVILRGVDEPYGGSPSRSGRPPSVFEQLESIVPAARATFRLDRQVLTYPPRSRAVVYNSFRKKAS